MGLALKALLQTLEARRREELDVPQVEPIRSIAVPVDMETCQHLRTLAAVFNAEAADIAALVLKAALIDVESHLDDDLGALVQEARKLVQ